MSEWFRWWLMVEVVALLALPLCLVLFARLNDRGYALSKAFGLLIVGWVFWMLNSLHLVPNSRGGIVASLLLVGLLAGAVAWSRRDELREFFEKKWAYVVGIEIAFIYVFAMAVWLRSLVGQIQNTEQPMDLMFLNAMTQAEHFPPVDPWLSGENVAYYYFGYLIVAMLGKLAGVPTEIGYNIGLGMIAALALLGAFGVVYNIIKLREREESGESLPFAPPAGGSADADAMEDEPTKVRRERASTASAARTSDGASAMAMADFNWRPYAFGIIGALMLVVMGNLVWLFKFASAYGIGWDGFYNWLDVEGLSANEPQYGRWYPSEFFGYFGATRLYWVNGADRAISEFPMFSFILGDLHPHVMSLPFVLVSLGLALTLFQSDEPLDLAFWLKRPLLLAGSALILGGLSFINTWDIVTFGFVIVLIALIHNWLKRPPPVAKHEAHRLANTDIELIAIAAALVVLPAIVLVLTLAPSVLMSIALVGGAVLLVAAFALYLSRDPWHPTVETFVGTLTFAAPLALLAALAFVPFYDGFSSQANGIYPVATKANVTIPGSRPALAILFWGPLFVVVVPYVVARLIAARDRITRRLMLSAVAIPLAIIITWAALFIVLAELRKVPELADAESIFHQLIDRGVAWLTAIGLGAVLTASVLALWLEISGDDRKSHRSTMFTLSLATIAFLLVLGCEFFYVGDLFHHRMNTVFKLYYQAWLLLAVAGAFALYELVVGWNYSFPRANVYRYVWAGATAAFFVAAALYPIGATMNRLQPYNEAGRIEELHGLDGISRYAPDELAAIAWLRNVGEHQKVVIAEAAGNDYTDAGRISAATGVPTVLGWGGHEDQWRGSANPRAGRFEDVQALYLATDLSEIEPIVDKYGITYIYVGQLERNTYGEPALEKFADLPVAFTSGGVTVYRAKASGGGAEAEPAP